MKKKRSIWPSGQRVFPSISIGSGSPWRRTTAAAVQIRDRRSYSCMASSSADYTWWSRVDPSPPVGRPGRLEAEETVAASPSADDVSSDRMSQASGRRELDPAELQVEHLGQDADQQRLAEAGRPRAGCAFRPPARSRPAPTTSRCRRSPSRPRARSSGPSPENVRLAAAVVSAEASHRAGHTQRVCLTI